MLTFTTIDTPPNHLRTLSDPPEKGAPLTSNPYDVVFLFDEKIQEVVPGSTNVNIHPVLGVSAPWIVSDLKRLTVSIEDTPLLPSTTYVLTIPGGSLQDVPLDDAATPKVLTTDVTLSFKTKFVLTSYFKQATVSNSMPNISRTSPVSQYMVKGNGHRHFENSIYIILELVKEGNMQLETR